MCIFFILDLVSICSPIWIDNVEIGRYFSKFEGTHYVPNKNLAEKYPTDVDRILEIFSRKNSCLHYKMYN